MTHIFIVNPYSGNINLAENLRERLSKIEGLNYFVFNTRYAGYEASIVRKIRHFFEGEELRFYCCGGSGTMRNILCGFDDISEAEIAYYPCGISNDFLKVFDCGEDPFRNLEALINGEVINVDVISTNYGYALNTVSLGLDAEVNKKMNDYRILKAFADWLPYTLALINVMFFAKQYSYNIELSDFKTDQTCIEMIFGNGNILGGNLYFSDSRDVFDGEGSYYVCPEVRGFKEIPVLLSLMKRNMDQVRKTASCGMSDHFRVRRSDGKPFSANFDGEIIKNITEIDARIIRKGLKLVVPRAALGGDKHE